MIEATVGEIVLSVPALQALMAEKMPASAAFRLVQLSRQVDPILEDFDKTRTSLVRRYGVEENGILQVPPKNMPAFDGELQELAQAKVTLQGEPLPVAGLYGVTMTPEAAARLAYLLME